MPTTPIAKAMVVSAPAPVATSQEQPKAARTFTLTCDKVEHLETSVVLAEKQGPHACIREVWQYHLEAMPSVESVPRMEFSLKTLEPQLFERRKKYLVTIQEA